MPGAPKLLRLLLLSLPRSGRDETLGGCLASWKGADMVDTLFRARHDSRARPARRSDRKASVYASACNWVLKALVHEQLSSLVVGFF
jgi:hypothetical protein